jgi:site-specific recombinase XerD
MSDNIIAFSKDLFKANTDSDFVESWLDGKSRKTQQQYMNKYESFKRYIDGISIKEAETGHVIGYLNQYSNSSKSTILAYKYILDSMFRHACRIGYMNFNPVDHISLVSKARRKAEYFLNFDEISILASMSGSARNKAIIWLMFYACANPWEIAKLKVKNIINGELGMFVHLPGKRTEGSLCTKKRYVKINDIQRHIRPHLREKSGNDPLFVSRNKKGHLSPEMIWRIVRAAGERIGKDDVTCQLVVRSGIEYWASNGMDMVSLSKFLGLSVGSVRKYFKTPTAHDVSVEMDKVSGGIE